MARLTMTDLGKGRVTVEWSFFGSDANDVTCEECGRAFWKQPADFLRYDRWRDAWVTKSEEDGSVMPDHGVCKECQDTLKFLHDEERYGGPNHDLIEQRIMEDERWVWAA
jgi:uncharacterized protein with PIN domain